ncbi:MAG TPA: haloacid dehalogenase-like hydrolase [Terriglobales bacterium]|nr:haloacid dehalogenase-like hydrolase [Terriglobales bacterium]
MATEASTPATEFVNSVLKLKPSLAVFDCDGTLWSGDAGEGFFNWELEQNLFSDEIVDWARQRYAAYREGKVSEDEMCGEMVTMHRGLTEAEVERAAGRYFEQHCVRDIFPEMRKLVELLQKAGSDVWVVSSTNEWVIRAAMRHFGIAPEKILAAAVHVVDGIITDRLIRVPSGEGKPAAIKKEIGRAPDAAFGNSIWDVDMLMISHHAFAINPTKQLETTAKLRKWPIYQPA